MRRLVNDTQPRDQPLEILEQKISVFEKSEHAQIHANTRDQPATSGMLIFGFSHLTTKPEVHRSGSEQQRSEWRVPGAIKNIARYDEEIFPRLPRANAPVNSHDDGEENDESE